MAYKINTLNYSIGPCEMKDNYFKPVNATIPIIGVPKFGLRNISITEEIVSDTEREAVEGLSFAQSMYLTHNEYSLGDGYSYFMVLDKVDTPKMHSPLIIEQTFHFIGFRYEEKVDITVSGRDAFEIPLTPTAIECDAKYTIISNAEKELNVTIDGIEVVNIREKCVIDGFRKTVEDESGNNAFGQTNLIDFPKVHAYKEKLLVTSDGKCQVRVEYYKIVI